ncbi:vitamin K epoxide reductase complex subunit 1-like protein 1 [Euwallacea fornicatus]|uniref:vitamin K epoxide reductase complex subunit 1-like protein 1 n=1 Tax=Euwallacea fornicatus TaxID=995702 RepID=UPI00338D6BB3
MSSSVLDQKEVIINKFRISRSSVALCNRLLFISSIIGCGLSIYAYSVEKSMEKNVNYKAYCDINPQISCTRVYESTYGKGLGIFQEGSLFHQPNSFFGIIFYTILSVFAFIESPVAVNGSLLLIIISNFISCYFAYLLYFILRTLCVICISIYVVNVINLILITKKFKTLRLIDEMVIQSVSERRKTK